MPATATKKAARSAPAKVVRPSRYIQFPELVSVLIAAPRDETLDLAPFVKMLESLRRVQPIRVLVDARSRGVGLPMAMIAHQMGLQYILCDLPSIKPEAWNDLDAAMFSRLLCRAYSWNLMHALGWGLSLANIVLVPACCSRDWQRNIVESAKKLNVVRRFISTTPADPIRPQIDPDCWGHDRATACVGPRLEFSGDPSRLAKRVVSEALSIRREARAMKTCKSKLVKK